MKSHCCVCVCVSVYPPLFLLGNGSVKVPLWFLKVKVTLRPTVSRSVRLGVEPHRGLTTRY
jgi:hypothetical protein